MSKSNIIMWSSELKTVQNTKTNKTRYYFHICGVWSRVSKAVYLSREADSNRADCFLTKIKGELIHHSKIIYGEHNKAQPTTKNLEPTTKNIKRIFNVINHNVFTINGTMEYSRVMDCFIKLCEVVNEYCDNNDDTENVWYIGEYTECNLMDLITGAYWHFSEWHSGQESKSYLCLSVLGSIYSPGMECADSENVAYELLNAMAEKENL